ncbi:hypothetical protein [Microscilla marina]|nr:hypothetical protein [Microscilla marina]
MKLNLPAQPEAIPSSMIDLFAQSLRVRLEVVVLDAEIPLEHLRHHRHKQLKNYLQAHLTEVQYLFNNFELLESLRVKKE